MREKLSIGLLARSEKDKTKHGRLELLLALLLFYLAISGCNVDSKVHADCTDTVAPMRGLNYEIQVDASRSVRKLEPEFFGFNLEWVEFQSSLWDSSAKQVKADAVQWLRAFPGAIYRYPGGTVSNFFDWRASIGTTSARRQQQPVSWRGPLVADFGPLEFLTFTKAVGGQPWYVLNLYGDFAGERQINGLARQAAELAGYMSDRHVEGFPAIYRWELGNELDRDRFLWEPEKYAEAAKVVMEAITSVSPGAKFVAMAQDWDASKTRYGLNASEYNTQVAQALSNHTREFASHLYYDGRPWGPPIPDLLRQCCRNQRAIAHGLAAQPSIWVTEHARTPIGTPDDPNWKLTWPQTASLGAAISVADMMISLSQMPRVRGSMLHSLHATDGPWPLFHRQKSGTIHPSAVYWALRMLRESMLEDVLATTVTSSNRSGYDGGYDIRAVAMSDTGRTKYSCWLINRASAAIDVRIFFPALAGKEVVAKIDQLGDDEVTANNYTSSILISPTNWSVSIKFDNIGKTSIRVPRNVVLVLSFETQPTAKSTLGGAG